MNDLRRFHCFIAVAESLHFRKAAQTLNITQPALSQQIREFEKELGALVFKRDRRSVSLTEAGKAFLPTVVEAVRLIEEAQRAVKSLNAAADRRLVLGYVEYLNLPFLTKTLSGLRKRHPEITVDVVHKHSDAVVQGLIDGEIDMGVAHMPITHPDLAARVVVDGHWMVALRDDHHLASKEMIDMRDLKNESLVLFSRTINPPLFDHLVNVMENNGLKAPIGFEVTQAATGPRYVLDGLGLFLHADFTLPYVPNGIVRRPVEEFKPVQLALVWRGDRRTDAITKFLDAHGRQR